MDPKFLEELIQELLKMGEILATKAFELAIKQVYLYATLDIVVGTIFLILGIVTTLLIRKNGGKIDGVEF